MDLLKPEPGLIVWELISFFGLLIVLWKFAWAPLLGMLDKRAENVRDSLSTAERTRDEAQALLDDYKKQLAQAREEAQKIIEEGRKFGESVKEEIALKAQKHHDELMVKANVEIAREKELALIELQTKLSDLIVDAAAKVVGAEVSATAHEKLIKDYLSKVGNINE